MASESTMNENINKQNEIPRLKRKKPKVYESTKQAQPEDQEKDEAPEEVETISRSYKGMDMNALDAEYEQDNSSRSTQQRRNTGHPSKDDSGKGVFGMRGNLLLSQINASFGTGTNEADLFMSSEDSSRKRESKSVDARNLHDFIDQTVSSQETDPLMRHHMSIIKGGSRPRSNMRQDRRGTVISRQTKQTYKISFADTVQNDKEKIADVYVVESYKKYNLQNTHGSDQQGCCALF